MKILCIGGPKDGLEVECGSMIDLIKEKGLHPGFTPEGEMFAGWYIYTSDALVYDSHRGMEDTVNHQ